MTAISGVRFTSAKRLRRGEPDDDAADQAGSGRRSDAVDGRQVALRFVQRAGDQQVEHFDMRARGNLRHHAAERRMLIGLRQNDVGQDLPAAVRIPRNDGRCGFVACCLDAENDHQAPCLRGASKLLSGRKAALWPAAGRLNMCPA